ncbi:hypothetical protein QQ045_024845 [Rhodiola kirilowii]
MAFIPEEMSVELWIFQFCQEVASRKDMKESGWLPCKTSAKCVRGPVVATLHPKINPCKVSLNHGAIKYEEEVYRAKKKTVERSRETNKRVLLGKELFQQQSVYVSSL